MKFPWSDDQRKAFFAKLFGQLKKLARGKKKYYYAAQVSYPGKYYNNPATLTSDRDSVVRALRKVIRTHDNADLDTLITHAAMQRNKGDWLGSGYSFRGKKERDLTYQWYKKKHRDRAVKVLRNMRIEQGKKLTPLTIKLYRGKVTD